MKTYRTVTRPAMTEQRRGKVFCDICKAEIPEQYNRVSEVTIKSCIGYRYPDNGHGMEKTCDICISCFETKVVPALEALGVTFIMTEWDY
jgi:hypothetical protein